MKLDRDRVIRAREMLGYSIETTAEEAGVSKNSVLRAEHEEDIRPVTARKIAAALGVRVADLIGESETLKVQPRLPDFNGEPRPASLRTQIDFIKHLTDRWEEEISDRESERELQSGMTRRAKRVFGDLSWASEIQHVSLELTRGFANDPNHDRITYDSGEVREIFAALRRMEEVVNRTDSWFADVAATELKTASVIDIRSRQQAREALEQRERQLGA